jgi:hypothetical protein
MNGVGSANFAAANPMAQQPSVASRKASYQDNMISAHAWTQLQHPNGFTYYWNSVTNSTAWGLPPEMKKAIKLTTTTTPVATGRTLELGGGGGAAPGMPNQAIQPPMQNNGFLASQPAAQIAQTVTIAQPHQTAPIAQTVNFHDLGNNDMPEGETSHMKILL